MRRNKFIAFLMAAFAPFAVLATISQNNILGNYADQITYGLALNHSNGISGSNVTIEKNIKTSSGEYEVKFEYSDVSTSSSGHCLIAEDGYIGNKDHILSIDSVIASYTGSGKLLFKTSYDYNTWSSYNEIDSGVTYHLNSHPYFLRFKASNGPVDITSISFNYTCQVNENIPNGTKSQYKLLTNANQLTVGNTYVIAASDVDYAISIVQNNNNRGAAEITRNNDFTISLDSNVCEFTLASGSVSGTYAFYDSNNKGYLYAASSSKNYLRTQSSIDANASFTISLDSSYAVNMTANGSNTRNNLYYNPNTGSGSPLFSCYSSFGSGYSHLNIYYLEDSGSSAPNDEIGFISSDAQDKYLVGDIFDETSKITASAKYSDGTYKNLSSNEFSYRLENSSGNPISTSTPFTSKGTYSCFVEYKSYIPVKFDIVVEEPEIKVAAIEAILVEDEFETTDILLLEDNLLFDLTYSDGSVVDSLEYSDLSTYGLALSLYNPNGILKSLDSTLSDQGEWKLVIYLVEDNTVYTEICFNVTKSSSDVSGWEIVTSSSKLIAGDEYVIASYDNGVAMGELDGKVFSYVNAEFTDIDFVDSFPSGTLIFTLGGSSSGWTFATPNGDIGTTAVKCMAYDNGTSTWLINFNANNAVISSTTSSYGTIYYNSSSPRFTTYTSSSMSAVQLYHKVDGTPIYPTSISIPSSIELNVGGTKQLDVTFTPSNTNQKNVTWSSSNSAVAQVNNGLITAVSKGTATIIAKAKNAQGVDISSNCAVTVSEAISPTSQSMSCDISDFNSNSYYDCDVTPSTGSPKLLVIPVWFTNSSNFISSSQKATVRSDIEKAYFGSNDETGWRSVKTFYEEESHGAVSLDGVVSDWYECGKSYTTYASNGDATCSLVESATSWYFSNNPGVSRKSFDSDSNGYLDGVLLIYAAPDFSALGNDNYDNLWAYCFWLQNGNPNKTNPTPNAFFWASYDFMYGSTYKVGSYYSGDTSHCNVDAHTYIHEMGHMFGLEDYYDYSGQYSPAGGFSMQDFNVGGHDPYSCLQLGWAKAIIPTSTVTISLKDFQSSGEVILLSPSWNSYNSVFDEYLLLELFTPTGLNKLDCDYQYSFNYPAGPKTVGIRVWHVDARIVPVVGGYIDDQDITCNPNCSGEGVLRVMSNTYWSSEEGIEDYCSIFGQDYANYNELQLIRKSTSMTYKTSSNLQASNLFVANDTFSMSTYAKQFVNSGKLNSNIDLGWTFKVNSIASNVASITVTKI